jgi:very-short-patch-repair endonuclease
LIASESQHGPRLTRQHETDPEAGERHSKISDRITKRVTSPIADGAAFHRERRADRIRDARLTGAGWTVVRFDGREIIGNIASCVSKTFATLEGSKSDGSPAT